MRGGYRDRLVIELAQNAADAAVAADRPGRLLFRLTQDALVAANVGAPLSADGVEALSTLRASAKRDAGTVGRFGVGFAAVLSVSDEPAIASSTGSVCWSQDRTAAAVAGIPALAAEVARRAGTLPVLRLPFPLDPDQADAGSFVPDGYDTAVRLPLRDSAALDLAGRCLAGVDDALMLALPALEEVRVEIEGQKARVLGVRTNAQDGTVTVVEGDRHTRWRRVERHGLHPAQRLADRPVEERARPTWSVAVAVPVDDTGAPVALPPGLPAVLHAPTPTDEDCSLPALVSGTFPLDPTRRRVATGPASDALVEEVATAYAWLVTVLADATGDPRVLDLVPAAQPRSTLDATLGAAVLAALRRTRFLPAADGPDAVARRLRPDEAVTVLQARTVLDPGHLATALPDLLAVPWWRREPLRRLGVQDLALADVVDGLAAQQWPAAGWAGLYEALVGASLDDLRGLPVPLIDGRLVRGPQGLLLPSQDQPLPGLDRLPVRLVHPDAVHPLLARLGAVSATTRNVLLDPALVAAVVDAVAARDGGWDPTQADADRLDPFPEDRFANDERFSDGRLAHHGFPDDQPAVTVTGSRAEASSAEASSAQASSAQGPSAEPPTTDSLQAWAGPRGEAWHRILTGTAAGRLSMALLELLRAGDAGVETFPWLADVALPDTHGELFRAGDLYLPEAPERSVLDDPPTIAAAPDWVDESLLRRCGVRAGWSVVYDQDVPLDGSVLHDLDDEDAWFESVLAEIPDSSVPPLVAEFSAVRDLDLVRDDAWTAALDSLAVRPDVLRAIVEPAFVLLPDGSRRRVQPYSLWWLRRHARVAGHWLAAMCAADAEPLVRRLCPVVPRGLDTTLVRALRLPRSVEDLASDPDRLLELLAVTEFGGSPVEVSASDLRRCYRAMQGSTPTPPDLVRIPAGASSRVIPAEDAVVVPVPYLLPLAGSGALPGPPWLAELLDVDLLDPAALEPLAELADGRAEPVPAVAGAVLSDAPDEYLAHDRLLVDGVDLDWWVDQDDRLHACTMTGLARGLAWVCGQWSRRALVNEALLDPDTAESLLVEDQFD